jgi:YgjP-like, metallopeptidase domain
MSSHPPVEVRRSARRRRTLSVFREHGRLVALVPQRLTRAQEAELLPPLVERFLLRESKTGTRLGEGELEQRAQTLYRRYIQPLSEVAMPTARVRWVDNQRRRWGSCRADTGEIRLSSRLRTMPGWVVDYVILHEVAHLLQPNHSAAFHRLLSGYPRLAEAKAFLSGYQHAVQVGATGQFSDLDDASEDCQDQSEPVG